MRISAKSDYAVQAMIEIAQAPPDRPTASDEIAESRHIPRTFLLTILGELRRAGLLRSRRGQSGGWSLARPAGEITVADVIRAVDGPLASVQGDRPEDHRYEHSSPALRAVWVAVRASLREVLEAVTVKDLCSGSLPAVVTERIAHDDAWSAR